MAKRHLEAVGNVLDEHDRNEPLDYSVNMCDFVELDATSEIFFDSMLETTEFLNWEVLMDDDENESCSEKGN